MLDAFHRFDGDGVFPVIAQVIAVEKNIAGDKEAIEEGLALAFDGPLVGSMI
jgi:hypothetical protein